MQGVLLGTLAAVLAALVVAGLAFVLGLRHRSRYVIAAVRRLARVTNRLLLGSAGHGDAFASVVQHTGRASGRQYRTPVHAVATDDGFAVALPYGADGDWVRNVIARGSAEITYRDRVYRFDRPRLVALREVETWFTAKDRRTHRLFRVSEALVGRRAPAEEDPDPGATATAGGNP